MGYATRNGDQRWSRRARAAAATVALAAVAILAPSQASAWAPARTASVHPGVMTFTKDAQCTANFVFTDATNVYLGQAAHCSSGGDEFDQVNADGCTGPTLPLGTRVEIDGADRRGTLVYSSWNTMKAKREKRENLCLYNDFALVRIAASDLKHVNPSVPGFGGPTGVGGADVGDPVYSYGNSSLRLGIGPLNPRAGWVVDVNGGGWNRTAYMATPGIPGDSGSGFMNGSGQAIGVLNAVVISPTPAANDVGDLGRELG